MEIVTVGVLSSTKGTSSILTSYIYFEVRSWQLVMYHKLEKRYETWMNECLTTSQNEKPAIGCQKKVNAWDGYLIKNWKIL